uniref:Uncharacterized protein n=1 Tax=Aegilops tauschii subsp. strangulata TaxID=200361 RepID=A0A453B9I9_AEGTS
RKQQPAIETARSSLSYPQSRSQVASHSTQSAGWTTASRPPPAGSSSPAPTTPGCPTPALRFPTPSAPAPSLPDGSSRPSGERVHVTPIIHVTPHPSTW